MLDISSRCDILNKEGGKEKMVDRNASVCGEEKSSPVDASIVSRFNLDTGWFDLP